MLKKVRVSAPQSVCFVPGASVHVSPCGEGRDRGGDREGLVGEVTGESGYWSVLRRRTILRHRKEVSEVPCEELWNKGMELRSAWERL